MKRTHILLPSLQVAATAFIAFTLGCHAEPYCVDKTTSEVLAAENYERDGDSTVVKGPLDAALGAVTAKRQDTNGDDDDDIDVDKYKRGLKEVATRMDQMKLVTGGFGNRDTCVCSNSQGGVVGGGGGIAGAGGRRGGSRGG